MKPLDIAAALFAIEQMPKVLGCDDEPFWDISLDKNVDEIEAFLGRPFQTFDGKELYKTPAEKAAVLFYQIIKDHKLENGNKRTAVILTLTFLFMNGYWLMMGFYDMYHLALTVAASKAGEREATMKDLIGTFDEKMVRMPWFQRLLLGRFSDVFTNK
ncbi:type II toxin-antitoxin system death-on-curing family toxin [Candidatus Saccharibacteria bacterium]|nr:type II toxin-antitoxin system death-on-curing family toxin [Candidatus Saccharibacteria bacterium]